MQKTEQTYKKQYIVKILEIFIDLLPQNIKNFV